MRFVNAMTLMLALVAVAPVGARAADCGVAPGDADGNGICDAVDPCDGLGTGWWLRETALTLRKLGGRPNDDSLRFRAVVPVTAWVTVDPATTGLRLTVLDNAWSSDDVVLDVAAPGGTGWVVNGGVGSWCYRSPNPGTSAIKRATVKEIASNPAYAVPRALLVTIDARRGT